MKVAVRQGMGRKGVRPDLAGIPTDLLISVAVADYSQEIGQVLARWGDVAAELEMSHQADDVRDAQLIDEIIAHVRGVVKLEEQKNARS